MLDRQTVRFQDFGGFQPPIFAISDGLTVGNKGGAGAAAYGVSATAGAASEPRLLFDRLGLLHIQQRTLRAVAHTSADDPKGTQASKQ